jgi:hypothetical protein
MIHPPKKQEVNAPDTGGNAGQRRKADDFPEHTGAMPYGSGIYPLSGTMPGHYGLGIHYHGRRAR